MLIAILKEIANTNTHSYATLAKTLNIDQELVRQVFYNLQSLGYIVSDDPACGDDRCDECGVCCTKKKNKGKDEERTSTGIRWKLTEKGKSAALGQDA